MRFSSLSAGIFRGTALALTLVFAAAVSAPGDAEAAHKKSHVSQKKKKSPQRQQAYQGGIRASIYINAETGEVLAQSNANHQIEPASLTKEMTAIIVFDAIRQRRLRLRDTLPLADATRVANQGAVTLRHKTGLAPGTPVSVDTLLAATAVASAADATITLAKGVCGGEECFTDLMNEKVRKILNLRDGDRSSTYFNNSHGMPGNRTTAHDLARIHQYMIRNYPQESRYFALTSYKINGRSYPGHNRLLVDYTCRNALGLPYKCLEASKTGYFRAAGFGIVGSAAWNGYRIIGVEMGHPSAAQRNNTLAEGLDAGFQTLERSGAPKTASTPWHFPDVLPKPDVEPEPVPGDEQEPDSSGVIAPSRLHPPQTPALGG